MVATSTYTNQGASLGNFPLFAQTGCIGDELNRCYFNKISRASQRINSSVEARAGYFAVGLNTSVKAEMTVSNHTVLYRFTFPTDGTPTKASDRTCKDKMTYSPLIHADLTDLADSRREGSMMVDGDTGRITGNGTFKPSFGIGTYKLNFCVDFKGAKMRDNGVWINNRANTEPKKVYLPDDESNPPLPGGAWVQFHPPDNNQILARVGLSFISAEQACQNAEKEIADFDFDATRNQAEDAWRSKLSILKVDNTGVSKSLQRTFWSGIYRTLLSPQDYTGKLGVLISLRATLTNYPRREPSVEE